jgi:hypothetical protein
MPLFYDNVFQKNSDTTMQPKNYMHIDIYTKYICVYIHIYRDTDTFSKLVGVFQPELSHKVFK